MLFIAPIGSIVSASVVDICGPLLMLDLRRQLQDLFWVCQGKPNGAGITFRRSPFLCVTLSEWSGRRNV